MKFGLLCTVLLAALLVATRPDGHPVPRADQVASLAAGRLDETPVAALTLAVPGRPELVYVRHRGRWRCATAFGAPVLEPAVAELVARLRGARGLVRDPRGAGRDEALVLGLHGPAFGSAPDRDRVLAVELEPLGERTLARALAGEEPAPWLEVPGSLARDLAWPPDRVLPPLVDDHLVACLWPDGFPGLARFFVDRPAGASLEVAPGEGDAWIARSAGREESVLPYRLAGYLNFLVRVRYRGLADPRESGTPGLDAPAARVTLATPAGEAVVLEVGRPANGQAFARNVAAELVGQVDPEHLELLAPDLDMLCDRGRANPWEEWLR